jgi:curved DNA-binding protein CbpA
MSCECAQCRQHYRTLGFTYAVPTESEILEAYREGVKQWHPDLFENYASLRADAEEHFKQIQVAYRELKEHNGTAEALPEESAAQSGVIKSSEKPAISFNGLQGCLAAQDFTEPIKEMIAGHLGTSDTPIAIVDLSGSGARAGSYSQFLLLAGRGIMIRDARKVISLLWYKDFGEVKLSDSQTESKRGLWQEFSKQILGGRAKCQLQIFRGNGSHFLTLADETEDNAKRIIYQFLLSKKDQSNS